MLRLLLAFIAGIAMMACTATPTPKTDVPPYPFRREDTPTLVIKATVTASLPLLTPQFTSTPKVPELFAVTFDANKWLWGVTEQNIGALMHRKIMRCNITLTAGHGLSPDWSVEHSHKVLGLEEFDVNAVSYEDRLQYITYCNSWGFYNCFQVSVPDTSGVCVQDAEQVLATYHHSEHSKATVTP